MSGSHYIRIRVTPVTFLMILLLTACVDTFQPDPVDPRLPMYSETGRDVAGSLINGDHWRSEIFELIFRIDVPHITAFAEGDSLQIVFDGNLESEPENDKHKISFHLKEMGVFAFEDLEKLRGQKVQLDGNVNSGSYSPAWGFRFGGGAGQIYFRNVEVTSSEAVISGTFGFTIDETPIGRIEITHGRFDYRFVDNENFKSK